MRFQIALLLLLCIAHLAVAQTSCNGNLQSNPNGCQWCHNFDSYRCGYCLPGYGSATDIGCTICPVGTYGAGSTGNPCTACPTGQTTSAKGKVVVADCFTEILGCVSQSSATVCTACATGQVVTNGGSSCGTTIPFCVVQSSASQCAACASGKALTLSGDACVTPISNCQTHGAAWSCLVCSFGFKPSDDQKSCVAVDSGALLFKLTAGVLLAAVALFI